MDVLKPFMKLLSEPPKSGAALGLKQVARTAAVVIRGTETRDGNSKLVSLLEKAGPVVFEFLADYRVPDLNGLCDLQQVIDVPMRSGG